jgi:hypothetical protein
MAISKSKDSSVDISPATRAVEPAFSEIKPSKELGPAPAPDLVGKDPNSLGTVTNTPKTVNTWKVMDKFDEGLKNALIEFIDTTKEGVKAPHSVRGRTKIITFNYQGTATKSVQPGEIGEFQLVLSYPAQLNTAGGIKTVKDISSALTS